MWVVYVQTMFHTPVKENTYVCGHLFISYNIQFCLILEYASVPESTVWEGAKLLFERGTARMAVKVVTIMFVFHKI
jgi:hypothetical protein